MKYVIPVVVILILVAGIVKKLPVYDLFVGGAKEAIDLSLSLFPYILAMCVLVQVMTMSGVTELLSKILSPVMSFLRVPEGLLPLIVFRPFSGSGSVALLENVYNTFGADSYESRVASVIAASSETIFYMGGIYFSAVKAKGGWKGVFIALCVSFVGVVLSSLFCRIM